jgi:hypothetical protein
VVDRDAGQVRPDVSRFLARGNHDDTGWSGLEAEALYHRTMTMTNTQTQTIDSTCATCSSVFVGPGRTFVTVVGTGETGLRAQVRCTPTAGTAPFASLNTSDASCPIWASIYTTTQPGSDYGALFITFNVDDNPKKARGY